MAGSASTAGARRAIAVTFTLPSFFTPYGFTNLHTTILELEVDRFFGPWASRFRGPWVAAGGGLALQGIDANDGNVHGSSSAFELSVGFGWAVELPENFYVDRWLGAEYQFTPSAIGVGTETWRPARFAPQVGMKIGWNVTF